MNSTGLMKVMSRGMPLVIDAPLELRLVFGCQRGLLAKPDGLCLIPLHADPGRPTPLSGPVGILDLVVRQRCGEHKRQCCHQRACTDRSSVESHDPLPRDRLPSLRRLAETDQPREITRYLQRTRKIISGFA